MVAKKSYLEEPRFTKIRYDKKKKKIKEASRQEQLKGAKAGCQTSHLERPRLCWAWLGHKRQCSRHPLAEHSLAASVFCYCEGGSSWRDLPDRISLPNIPLRFPLQAERVVEGDLPRKRVTRILLCGHK